MEEYNIKELELPVTVGNEETGLDLLKSLDAGSGTDNADKEKEMSDIEAKLTNELSSISIDDMEKIVETELVVDAKYDDDNATNGLPVIPALVPKVCLVDDNGDHIIVDNYQENEKIMANLNDRPIEVTSDNGDVHANVTVSKEDIKEVVDNMEFE